MKKIIAMVALVFSCMLAYAQTNGEVIVMNKAMFIKDVFDYETVSYTHLTLPTT